MIDNPPSSPQGEESITQKRSVVEEPVSPEDSLPPFQSSPIVSPPPQQTPDPFTGTPKTDSPDFSDTSPQGIITTQSKSGGKLSKFLIFIGILSFITVIIYILVGYLYFQNNKLKKEAEEQNVPTSSPLAFATPTPIPMPGLNPEDIKIVNGSVVRANTSGESTTLVDKADYSSTGITGFAKVTVSPDTKKMCFESWPPAPEPALYIANIDGSELKEVSPNRKGCQWISDSSKIVYIGIPFDTQPTDIFQYDILNEEETNLTSNQTKEGYIRYFQINGLTENTLECSYQETGAEADGTTTEGNCEINLTTLEVEM